MNTLVRTILLFLFSFQCILSQSAISGKIVNTKNEPIPYATIRIENTNKGTISNDVGVFTLVITTENKNKRLVISSLGYKTKIVTLTNDIETIILTEDITQLSEVLITSNDKERDYARELIEKAIKAIPNNYPTTSEQHTGFLRETTTGKNKEKPIYIAEAVVEAIKEDYRKKNRSGHVKLVEFRKYEGDALDSLNFRIYAGSHHIHRFDIVTRKDAFLSKPENYNYQIVDTLRQNGTDIFKVLVKEKSSNSAHIYIQNETFAIVKADIKLNSNFGVLGAREFLNYTVVYKQSEDKLWRFSNSYYTTAFTKGGRTLNLISEYVTTDIIPSKTKIPYIERLQFTEILLDETKAYDPNFWDNYTIISPNDLSEALFKSIDYTKDKEDEETENGLLSFKKKLSFEMGLSWTAFNIASHSVSYTNSGIDIQENNKATNEGSVSYDIAIFYTIKPHFLVGYSHQAKLTKTGISANDIVVASKINLNPNGRPINISPRLHFGYQELDYFLERFKLENDIRIDGEKIDSDKLDAFLSQRGFRFKPSLAFSIEKSKKISFLISAAYNIPLNSKNGLTFREKGGFLLSPKRVFLENGQENLSVETNRKDVFKNTISVNATVAYRF